MAPQTEKFDDDVDNAAVPGREADKSLGAPPITRTAAALDFAQAAVNRKRRRINKTAVHRELGTAAAGAGYIRGRLQRASGYAKDDDLLRRSDGKRAEKGGCGGDEAKARIQRGCEGAKEATKAGCLRGGGDGAFGWLRC